MKRFCMVAFCLCFLGSSAHAQDKTSTGFYYPTGHSTWPRTGGNWLSRDAAHGGGYVDGYYHIAQDMPIAQGSSVYAISEGDVVKIYTTYAGYVVINGVNTYTDDVYGLGSSYVNGRYIGNSVIFVQHTLQDGSHFLAEYMHVQPTVVEHAHVLAGHVIATVGPYQYSQTHLHFGVHPSTTWPTTNWGRMLNRDWANPNGFVDPANSSGTGWIQTKIPFGESISDTDIWVDGTRGSGGNGSQGNPFNTVLAAVNAANASQPVTIHITPGVYSERISTSKHIHFVTNGSGTVRIGG